MPAEIAEYRPADWLELGDAVSPPADCRDLDMWSRWENAQLSAHRRFVVARERWIGEHGLPELDAAALPDDEPFDGDSLLVFDGQRVTRGELAAIQGEMRAGERQRP